MVTVGENDPLDPAGTQLIDFPTPETSTPDGNTLMWWPFYVTWSPDSTTLLYGAWAYANNLEVQSVLEVRVDGETPPVVLYETPHLSPYSGVLRLHFQNWSRQQG